MNVEKVETCNNVRTAMKVWNTTVQYWMANCVYKRFPFKGLRTAAVFLLSSAWHGYAPGYFLCISQITFFLPMEDIYMKIYKQSPDNSPVCNISNFINFDTNFGNFLFFDVEKIWKIHIHKKN